MGAGRADGGAIAVGLAVPPPRLPPLKPTRRPRPRVLRRRLNAPRLRRVSREARLRPVLRLRLRLRSKAGSGGIGGPRLRLNEFRDKPRKTGDWRSPPVAVS